MSTKTDILYYSESLLLIILVSTVGFRALYSAAHILVSHIIYMEKEAQKRDCVKAYEDWVSGGEFDFELPSICIHGDRLMLHMAALSGFVFVTGVEKWLDSISDTPAHKWPCLTTHLGRCSRWVVSHEVSLRCHTKTPLEDH